MAENNENKGSFGISDVLKGLLGYKLVDAGKDKLLGVTTLYHGTPDSAAKSIKREGLLTTKSNDSQGGTAWLADFIKSMGEDDLKQHRGKTTLYGPHELFNGRTTALDFDSEFTVNLDNLDSHVKYNNLSPEGAEKFKRLSSFDTYGGSFADSGGSRVYVDKKYASNLSSIPIYEIDDQYISKAVENIPKDIIKNSEGRVFVTKYRPHGNFYSYMSKPGLFTKLMYDIQGKVSTIKDEDEGAKVVIKELLKSYMKAQNPLNTLNSTTLKIKMPTALFDKNFTMDTVIENEDLMKGVEKMKNSGDIKERLMYKMFKNFQAKSEVSIPSKYISKFKRPSVYVDALKHLPEYVASHPVKATLGAGMVTAGALIARKPAEELKEKLQGVLKKYVY